MKKLKRFLGGLLLFIGTMYFTANIYVRLTSIEPDIVRLIISLMVCFGWFKIMNTGARLWHGFI